VLLTIDAGGMISHARLAFTGATPIRRAEAEAILLGQKPSDTLFREASQRAIEGLEQDSDIHASAEYRRHVCGVLARRACAEAAQRAAQAAPGSPP
jgi:carbon-monoxide dehydrogenase medium subunit